MAVIDTSVFSNLEWNVLHRIAEPGTVHRAPSVRNGLLMDVPLDPIERNAFMEAWPYAELTPKNLDRVFVYRLMQLMVTGGVQMEMPDGTVVGNPVSADAAGGLLACVYPPHTWDEDLRKHGYFMFPQGCEWYCLIPKESTLLWHRAPRIGTEPWVTPTRVGNRHRLILARGEALINNNLAVGPTIVPLVENYSVVPQGKIYAAEVWV